MAYFFLSYANADDDDYLGRFFADLRGELRRRAGCTLEEAGFRDTASIGLGARWSAELAAAVSACRVFVAICSPSYFTSDFCGREWRAFASRMEHYAADGGPATTPPLIIPVVWVPSRQVPDVIARVQYRHEDLGSTYAAEGLHFLLRLRRHRDDYEEFLARLAERIIDAAERYPLPVMRSPVDLEEVVSAFPAPALPAAESPADSPVGGGLEGRPRPEAVRRGPRHVTFIVAAGSEHEMARVRGRLSYYGSHPYDWSPYRPSLDRRLSAFAQHVVANQDLTSTVAVARTSILDRCRRARRENSLVVLLVDIWSTRLEPYSGVLREFDARNEPTTGVMFPWNDEDPETSDQSGDLRDDLWRVLPNGMTRSDALFRVEIPTAEAFERMLLEVLAEAQNRLFRFGSVGRWASGAPPAERPILGLGGG